MTVHRSTGGPKVVMWPTSDLADRLDVSDLVLSFHASKNLEAPAGQWTITLVPRQGDRGPGHQHRIIDVYKRVRTNSLVSIGYDEPGGIMLGLVSRITRVRRAGAQASYGLQLSGMDLGKLLIRDNLENATVAVGDLPRFEAAIAAALGDDSPLLSAIRGIFAPTVELNGDRVPTFLGATVEEAVTWILEHAPSMRLPLFRKATGGEGKASDIISTDYSVTTWSGQQLWSDALSSFYGSVYQFIRQTLDADFYELMLDTTPNGSALANVELIIRPKPFDEPELDWLPVDSETGLTWTDLRTRVRGREHHEVAYTEVHAESLGVSDDNVVAYYLVQSQHELAGNAQSAAEGLQYPLIDTYAAKRHGISSYRANLLLANGDVFTKSKGEVGTESEVAAGVREYRNRLLNWYRLAEWFEAGSITVVGRDEYRPGDPVYLDWVQPQLGEERGLRYYCTAVSWSWSFGGAYRCELTLDRGHSSAVIQAAKAIIEADAPAASPNHLAET